MKGEKMIMSFPETQDLANEFVIVIREWLTPEQLAEIDKRNATDDYKETGCCATHDFCDANQAMIDALERFNVALDIQDEAQRVLIDDAWQIAKRDGFSVSSKGV